MCYYTSCNTARRLLYVCIATSILTECPLGLLFSLGCHPVIFLFHHIRQPLCRRELCRRGARHSQYLLKREHYLWINCGQCQYTWYHRPSYCTNYSTSSSTAWCTSHCTTDNTTKRTTTH